MPYYQFAVGARGDTFRIDAYIRASTPVAAVEQLKSNFTNEVEIYQGGVEAGTWVAIRVNREAIGEQHIIRVDPDPRDET